MRIKLGLIFAALILSLGIGELALRRTTPLWVIPYPPVCYRPDLFERFDAYGYRLWPKRTFQLAYPDDQPRTVTVVSNSDGFRSRRDFHVPDERRRIVVLGDSMVFGIGVEESERFTDVVETMEPGWRVDNLGMIGYGPDLMLRALEAVGLDPAPDVVVFAIFSHDFYRVAPEAFGAGFPLPRFVLEDGRLVTVPYPIRPWWQRLYLVQGLRYVYWRYTGASFPLNAAILDRFLELARERGFRGAIVFVPGPRDWRDDRRRRGWLRDYAERRGTPFLDLTGPLQAAGGERLYIRHDAHWNVDGHRVVGRELHPFLTHVLAASSPGP